jgi:outer membrane receptor protein involved in Fe transport
MLVCLLSVGVRAQDPAAVSESQAPAEQVVPLSVVVVVTPNRGSGTTIIDAPAAVSVLSREAIALAPDRSLAELLRAVPGVNVVMGSIRDHEVTSRQATSTLPNSQLVLLDGRSVYQDFIGTILWDMIPVAPGDIDQIEVVRGPASAVWGANAFTGVVNIVTRSPRAAEGSSVELGLAGYGRDAGSLAGRGAGLAYRGSTSLSRALDDRLAFRASGGLHVAAPLARPTGEMPVVSHPLVPESQVGGGRLPLDEQGEPGDYRNRGTTQPWMDLRFDQELAAPEAREHRITYAAGIAGSDGIVHTGIGPFNLERGSVNGYARVSYRRDRLNVMLHASALRVKGPNLLAFDVDEEPLRLSVRTKTFGLDASDSRLLGSRQIVTYGATVRRNLFRVSLAPGGKDRTELGAFVQDELFLGWGRSPSRELRIALGARLDRFGNIEGPVLSPRLSCIWKPSPHHSIRLSVNKAFRSPSLVNNYLDRVVLRPVDLKPLFPELPAAFAGAVEEDFLLPQRVLGDPDLREESLTSYEAGYVGSVGSRTAVGVSAYRNDTRDNINFFRFPDHADPYTEQSPPEGWPLPPSLLSDLAARGIFLARVSNQFRNLGPIRHRGIEAFVEHTFGDGLAGYLNYSWQPDPRPLPATEPFPPLEISLPPRHRVNAGVSWNGRRFVGSLSLNHADRAFWVDVFPHDFDGWTDAYTMFNGSFGVRWADGRIVTTVRGTNLTNAEVRQHTFADVVKRAVFADVRFSF